MGIVSQLLEPGLAPRMPAFAAATRLAANVPLVEGAELREAGYEFESEITVDGTLRLDMRFREAASLSGRTIWIAFEANRQWLCLGFVEVGDRAASMLLPGFGKLLDLSPGPLPANIFAVRLDEWPSVCEHGALIVQSGPEPFAEIETDPLIENGNVRVGIRLLPYSADAWRSTEIEMWFGTGGHVWQLLGRWPLPEERGASMNLICPSPKPGPVGVAFPGVLRLALRS
jgi:hypothetical protein